MIEVVPTFASSRMQDVVYDELSKFGIFNKTEQTDVTSILRRFSQTENIDCLTQILGGSHSSIALNNFYQLLLEYCIQLDLYSVLSWSNIDFRCCDIQDFNTKQLNLMIYLKYESNFANYVGQNILRIADFLSTDIGAYLEDNPLVLLAIIFFLHPDLDLSKLKKAVIKLNNFELSCDNINNALQKLPFFNSVLSKSTCRSVTYYDLLKICSSLDLNIFNFQIDNSGVPSFNCNDLVQKYAYKKTINYIFYLNQARPCFASKIFLSSPHLTSKTLDKLNINRKVLKLFIDNLDDDELAVSCITFLEMIGENSISLRIYVKLAKLFQQLNPPEDVKKLLREVFKNPEHILEELERVLIRNCCLTHDTLAMDVVEEIKKQEIAIKLSQLHNIKLPEVFLKYCAELNLWLPFLIYIQIYNYPLGQVQRLVQCFQNCVITEHLYHSFTHEIQIDTQKELLMRDSRTFYLSRIGVRKNVDASSDSLYSSASSYGSTGSSSTGSDLIDGESFDIETDFLRTLIRCHNSIDPPKALLQACYIYKCPIFAVLATSYEPDSVITHWLMWICVSCGLDREVSTFETACVDANLVSNLLLSTIKMGFSQILYESLQIFLPDNPLVLFVDFLNECINLNFNFGLQMTKLQLYWTEVKKKKICSPIVQVDYEMMYLSNKVWIDTTALNLLAVMLQYSFKSRFYQLQCLQFLHDIEIYKYFTTSLPDFLRYFQIVNYLFQNECDINLDLSVIFNDDKANDEVLTCVKQLISLKFYECAFEIAKLQQLSTDFIAVKEWYYKFQKRNNDKEFWANCNKDFNRKGVDSKKAIEFFVNCCRETNGIEKYTILKIAHKWASENKLDIVYDLEKKMWVVYFSLETKIDWDSINKCNESLLYGEMKQILDSLVDTHLEKVDCIHLNDTIEKLLNEGNLWQALRVSKIFNCKNDNLEVIKLCYDLAEGYLMPYQLNVEQRMSLLKYGNLRMLGQRRRRPLISSKGFCGTSSASNSPISSVLSTMVDSVDVPIHDTLMILETVQERVKSGEKIIQNIHVTYRIAVNIEKSYQDVFKCSDPFVMIKEALNDDCCNKLEVVHDIITLFNWSKYEVGNFLCDQLIGAINDYITFKTSSLILWNLNLDTDFNVILQLLIENCSTFGLKLYSYANTIYKSQLDLTEELAPHNFSLIVELLIRSHDCFTADCNMEGISIILRKCESIIALLLQLKNWKLIVRLLTGVARYTEMNYVFHILRENDQFEYLLCRGCRKDNSLKVAVLKYLKKYCPENRELYRMVALHFTLFSEIAQLWELEAKSIIRNLIAISKLEMQNNGLNTDAEPFVLLTHTDGTKICINKAMINYTHAAEYHLQGEKLTKAMQAAKQAELLALQMSMLRGLPSNSTTKCILNTSEDQILSLICTSLSFPQSSILIDSNNYKPDWATILFEQYIIRDQTIYFENFLAVFPLTDIILNDIAKKFLCLNGSYGQSVKNMREIVRRSNSVHIKYKIASELGFTDLIEDLLESNQLAYLKDTVWKKGYKS
ncbi:hypothetical protein FQA39_LY11871 [Lamprigera yunnana]|nr:hypothetical protein FQA39_LY11871 [Lamprigera yunnana]